MSSAGSPSEARKAPPARAENLCAGVRSLSLEETQNESRDDGTASERLLWYDRLLPFVARSETSALDWKAWANCGACLYQLGEKKASWDAYRQAALAAQSFQRDLADEELLADLQLGKFFRQLDREFRSASGWASEEADDIALFVLLVRLGRGSEVASRRWHEILPNHYFAVTKALCRKLSTPARPLEQVCPDDSRADFSQGNFLALLASPSGLFVETSSAKRAKLQPCVEDVCVELRSVGDGSTPDFEVQEVEQPDD